MGRADRSVGKVMRRAWEMGATNDGWWMGHEESFKCWSRAIEEEGLTWKYRQVNITYYVTLYYIILYYIILYYIILYYIILYYIILCYIILYYIIFVPFTQVDEGEWNVMDKLGDARYRKQGGGGKGRIDR